MVMVVEVEVEVESLFRSATCGGCPGVDVKGGERRGMQGCMEASDADERGLVAQGAGQRDGHRDRHTREVSPAEGGASGPGSTKTGYLHPRPPQTELWELWERSLRSLTLFLAPPGV